MKILYIPVYIALPVYSELTLFTIMARTWLGVNEPAMSESARSFCLGGGDGMFGEWWDLVSFLKKFMFLPEK